MPTQTFFNLPDDKKELLLFALEKEFSRVSLFDASISNIVKTADIPRGSFYQYFKDKEDAYFYLLNQLVERSKQTFKSVLEKHNGDLFEAITDMYEIELNELSKGEHVLLLKNAFLNMTHEIENILNRIFNGNGGNEQFEEISLLINKRKLNITNDVELFHLMHIITAITFRNLIEMIAKDLPADEAIENFKIEINLLRKGCENNKQ